MFIWDLGFAAGCRNPADFMRLGFFGDRFRLSRSGHLFVFLLFWGFESSPFGMFNSVVYYYISIRSGYTVLSG